MMRRHAGSNNVFTACDLYAQTGLEEKLVATGDTLLMVVKGEQGESRAERPTEVRYP